MTARKLPMITAIGAALAGGAVTGALLFTPAISGAQTDGGAPPTEAPAGSGADESTDHGDRPGHHRCHRLGRHVVGHLREAAEVLGLDGDALREALRSGQTLAEVAEANGVDADVLIDALVAAKEAAIDEKVADGDLTAEQAAEIKAGLTERVTAFVHGERPDRPEGFGRRPGPAVDPTST